MEGKKMKRMIILNLWTLMMGWCLYFSNLTIMAIILLALLIGCNLYLFNKVNYWRFTFIFTLISILCIACLYLFKLPYSLSSLPFLLLIGANNAYINEICYLMKYSFIKKIDRMIIITGLCFIIVALFIPYSSLLPNYKTNLYGNITMMFSFPFINLSTCLFYKSRRNKACIIKAWNL